MLERPWAQLCESLLCMPSQMVMLKLRETLESLL